MSSITKRIIEFLHSLSLCVSVWPQPGVMNMLAGASWAPQKAKPKAEAHVGAPCWGSIILGSRVERYRFGGGRCTVEPVLVVWTAAESQGTTRKDTWHVSGSHLSVPVSCWLKVTPVKCLAPLAFLGCVWMNWNRAWAVLCFLPGDTVPSVICGWRCP